MTMMKYKRGDSFSQPENPEPVKTNSPRVPPSTAEVQKIAADIKARQSMTRTLRAIGARPPEAHDLAWELVYQAGLPKAALPLLQKMFERLEKLEDEISELRRRVSA